VTRQRRRGLMSVALNASVDKMLAILGSGVSRERVIQELRDHADCEEDATASLQSVVKREHGNKLFASGDHAGAL
jgi:hypothetical protein